MGEQRLAPLFNTPLQNLTSETQLLCAALGKYGLALTRRENLSIGDIARQLPESLRAEFAQTAACVRAAGVNLILHS